MRQERINRSRQRRTRRFDTAWPVKTGSAPDLHHLDELLGRIAAMLEAM
jgi:hypothetical protein